MSTYETKYIKDCTLINIKQCYNLGSCSSPDNSAYYVPIFTLKSANRKTFYFCPPSLTGQNQKQLTREPKRLKMMFSQWYAHPAVLISNWSAVHVEWVQHWQPWIMFRPAMLTLLTVLLVEEGRAFCCMHILTLYFLSFPLFPVPCLLCSKWNLLQ